MIDWGPLKNFFTDYIQVQGSTSFSTGRRAENCIRNVDSSVFINYDREY